MTKDTATYRDIVNAIEKLREESKADKHELQIEMDRRNQELKNTMDLKISAVLQEVKDTKQEVVNQKGYISGNFVPITRFIPVESSIGQFLWIVRIIVGAIATTLIGLMFAWVTNAQK